MRYKLLSDVYLVETVLAPSVGWPWILNTSGSVPGVRIAGGRLDPSG